MSLPPPWNVLERIAAQRWPILALLLAAPLAAQIPEGGGGVGSGGTSPAGSDGDIQIKSGPGFAAAAIGEGLKNVSGTLGADDLITPRYYTSAGAPTAANVAGRDFARDANSGRFYRGVGATSWEEVPRVYSGSGAPSSGACDAAAEVGSLYYRTDSTGGAHPLYVCGQPGTGVYGWTVALLATGNAATATALAANPANCSGTQKPAGIAANGDAEGCSEPGGGGSTFHAAITSNSQRTSTGLFTSPGDIPANTLAVGSRIEMVWGGIVNSSNSGLNYTLEPRFGSAAIVAGTFATANLATSLNLPFRVTLTCTVRTTGASGTMICTGGHARSDSSTTHAIRLWTQTSTVTIDTTVDQTVNLHYTMSGSTITADLNVAEVYVVY